MPKILVFLAVVCFILAAFGAGVAGVSLGWLGLALYAGSGLVS
jgi:hypothetical protein